MKLSIIIVNWNTYELLEECLQSVLENISNQQAFEAETFIVDNASTDGSAQRVKQRFPWVQLIENQENAGFARANNQAIRQSSGRYLLLLNPDTRVQPGALEFLVRFMEDHPQVGAAGARLLNPDGTLQISCYPGPTLFREFWRLLHLDVLWPLGTYRMADWDVITSRRVEVIQGACLIARREALNQAPLLDEGYFIYSEDVDLCYRLRQAGWQLYWVPQAEVVHYGGQSTSQTEAAMFLRLYQGKVLYFRKHRGWWPAQVYKLILLIAALIRQLLSPLVWLTSPTHRRRKLILARYYRKLLRALPSF